MVEVPLDLPGRMEDKEEPEPTIRKNKLTRPLLLSILGSNFGFLQYGYSFFLITHPVVRQMQLVTLEGIDIDSLHFQFLIIITIIFVPLGGLFGVFLWGCLADRYGRKSTLLISNGVNIFSSAVLCLDKIFRQFEFSLFARFLAGIGSGIFTYGVPLYVLEISPLNLRGTFVTSSVLFFNWGQLLVQILTNPQIWGNEENYSLLVGIISIFAIISSVLLMFSPESPRFLYLQRNDEDKARQALKELRGEEDVEQQMEELRQEHLAESNQKNMTVWKFLCFRGLRWHLITILVLVSGSQFVETNSVLIFAQESYRILGLSKIAVNLFPLFRSLATQLMLLTAVCTVESLGRRFLLLSGFLMCSISNIALVFTFQINTPTMAYISIILIILFFMGHITGPASILLLIIGELFLQSSRASAYVLAGLLSWGTNFVSAILFLLTNSYLGPYYLLLYWPFIVLTYIYVFRVVPETTGKTFQEIQENMAACISKNSRKITVK